MRSAGAGRSRAWLGEGVVIVIAPSLPCASLSLAPPVLEKPVERFSRGRRADVLVVSASDFRMEIWLFGRRSGSGGKSRCKTSVPFGPETRCPLETAEVQEVKLTVGVMAGRDSP